MPSSIKLIKVLKVIKKCFTNRKERDLIYYGFIICYFIFFYYEQVIGGVGLGYKSDYF